MRYLKSRSLSARPVLVAALVMVAAAAGFATAAAAADSAPAAGTPQPARWTQKKIFFVYEGIQTTYSCEALTDQVREVLLELGARNSDIDVHETGCTSGFNAQTPHPGVAGTFSVLEPVSPEQAYSPSATPGTVAAHWQPVQLHLAPPGRDVNGQCELLDQLKHRILPLFATRNVQYQSTCSPRQVVVGGTSLHLEVLVPDSRTASQ
jgi:hypothetical protein